MRNETEIKTTGHLRSILADAAAAVINGDLDIDKANALHKLAKNISDSLYSETKIKMLQMEANETVSPLGELPLGDPTEAVEY